MSVAVVAQGPTEEWVAALREAAPDLRVQVWPEIVDAAAIEAALIWKSDPAILAGFPRLRLVMSMGAGVDHVLSRGALPHRVRLTRVVDDDLSAQMAQYVVYHVLRFHRHFDLFAEAKLARVWNPPSPAETTSCTVGLMGYGNLGRRCSGALRALGFPVVGYRRTASGDADVPVFHGDEFPEFLSRTNVLVCLLPLSPETRGILNARTLSQLPEGAYLIAAGRGEQLVEDDVVEALRGGRLAGAALDVFPQEPLPADSPFWKLPQVFITPHCAADVQPARAVALLLENARRLELGLSLVGEVDLSVGY